MAAAEKKRLEDVEAAKAAEAKRVADAEAARLAEAAKAAETKAAEPEAPAAPARRRVSPDEIIARAYERAGQAPPPPRAEPAAPAPAPAPLPADMTPPPRDASLSDLAAGATPVPLPDDMAPPPRDASLADLAAGAMGKVAAAFTPPAPAPPATTTTTTTAPRAPGVGRMLVPEAGAGPPPPPEPKTLVPQVDGRAAAPPLVPPPIDTMASDDPRGTTAWAAVVGGGSVFDPPSFRDLSPEDFQKQWAQNIIADNARRRRRGELAERIMGAEAAPAPPPERAAPAPSAAARALMEAFDGRLGRVTVAMKAEAAQMSAAGRFAVAEHAPQRDGRELLKLRDGAAELVIDANRVVDIAYEDRGVLGLTVVVSGRGGAFMLATLDGDDAGARERFFSLAE